MARLTLQERIQRAVADIGAPDFSVEQLASVVVEPWWVDHLAASERAIRELRHRIEALTTDHHQRTCNQCGMPISGRSDRKFCSDACRIKAHRATTRAVAPGDRL